MATLARKAEGGPRRGAGRALAHVSGRHGPKAREWRAGRTKDPLWAADLSPNVCGRPGLPPAPGPYPFSLPKTCGLRCMKMLRARGSEGDPGQMADAKMSLERPDHTHPQVGCYSWWQQAKPQMGDTPEE